MQLNLNKKIYFASDQHFGAPTPELSFPREQKFVAWLDEVKEDAEAIFLLGDLFDFWFEYKTVVPKGFIRVLGKLAEIRDSGIPIYFFVGNHDLWMADYFQKELNIPVFHDNREFCKCFPIQFDIKKVNDYFFDHGLMIFVRSLLLRQHIIR